MQAKSTAVVTAHSYALNAPPAKKVSLGSALLFSTSLDSVSSVNSTEAPPVTDEDRTAQSDTPTIVKERVRSLDLRSSHVFLLMAFIIGLALGLLFSVLAFVRLRKANRAERDQPQLDMSGVVEDERLASPLANLPPRVRAKREVKAAPASASRSPRMVEPAVKTAADRTSAGSQAAVHSRAPKKLPRPPASLSSPTRNSAVAWTTLLPQSFTPASVVQLETQAKLALVRKSAPAAPPSPTQPGHDAELIREKDVHRAGALLAQGELVQALAMIEPYVKNWLPTPMAWEGDSPDRSMAESLEMRQTTAPEDVAKLYADICWEMVIQGRQREDLARGAEALRVFLSIKPDDTPTRLCLAHCLINLADCEPDDVEQATLLQSCIDTLQGAGSYEPVPDLVRLGMLGEARCRRALLDLPVDIALLDDAERTLRMALARGASTDSAAAWWLQALLGTSLSGLTADVAAARLQEAIALLRKGLETHSNPISRPRWQAALLRAELEQICRTPLNLASRRLRLRDLYNDYVQVMRKESAPEVLAAWIDLLCAVVAPMVGAAAIERYREIDEVLARLSEFAPASNLHAKAWMQMMHSRLLIENEAGKRRLLEQAEAILAPHMEEADKSLRLQACKLALEQAALALNPEARDAAYVHALDLARPLTAMPSVALMALGCAMNASLALGDDKERRVYANCLRVIGPDDVDSLGLLAQSAYRDGDVVRACLDLELAWQRRDKALPEALLDLWQTASRKWAEQAGNDEACRQNLRYLRLADARRRR
jgi:tetratricopeptide (TPR) repeat protein